MDAQPWPQMQQTNCVSSQLLVLGTLPGWRKAMRNKLTQILAGEHQQTEGWKLSLIYFIERQRTRNAVLFPVVVLANSPQSPCESRAAGEAGQPWPWRPSVRGTLLGRDDMTLIHFLKNSHCNTSISCPENTKCFTRSNKIKATIWHVDT